MTPVRDRLLGPRGAAAAAASITSNSAAAVAVPEAAAGASTGSKSTSTGVGSDFLVDPQDKVTLHILRELLLAKGLSSEKLGIMLELVDTLWERKVLHAPIVYRPAAYLGTASAGAHTAQLEEVSAFWLAQANEMFSVMDPAVRCVPRSRVMQCAVCHVRQTCVHAYICICMMQTFTFVVVLVCLCACRGAIPNAPHPPSPIAHCPLPIALHP